MRYMLGSIPILLTVNHSIFIAPGHVFKLMMLLGGLPRSLGDALDQMDGWETGNHLDDGL